MPADSGKISYRAAARRDANAIAALHAESWRQNYRGAYSDAFLDGDVLADRQGVWGERLAEISPDRRTIAAEVDGRVVGFVHVVFDDDPVWGALLDNLHVSPDRKRQGIGSRLMAMAAQAVAEARPASGLYLWVHEQNRAAQAFYESLGAAPVGRELVPPPGGDPSRLNGAPVKLRYAWTDPNRLPKAASSRRAD